MGAKKNYLRGRGTENDCFVFRSPVTCKEWPYHMDRPKEWPNTRGHLHQLRGKDYKYPFDLHSLWWNTSSCSYFLVVAQLLHFCCESKSRGRMPPFLSFGSTL